MRQLSAILISLVLCCWGMVSQAASAVDNFNTITVPVASQSPQDLQAALVEALTQVLVKLSGNVNVAANPTIKNDLAKAERFVQQYSYSGTDLQVVFERRALVAMLTEANLPIWLANRPVTLVWLSLADGPPVTDNGAQPVVPVLQANAVRRGIAFSFPQMNEEDQMTWQAGQATDQATLEKLAQRYQAPAIVSGQMQQSANQLWQAQWFLVWRGQTWQWHSDGQDLNSTIQAAVDKIADLMAAQLAVNLGQQAMTNIWLAVLDVNDLMDYSQALHTVQTLQPVMRVSVQDVGSHGLLLRVATTGEGTLALTDALTASQHFTAMPNQTDGVLSYRWVH